MRMFYQKKKRRSEDKAGREKQAKGKEEEEGGYNTWKQKRPHERKENAVNKTGNRGEPCKHERWRVISDLAQFPVRKTRRRRSEPAANKRSQAAKE